MMGQTRVAFAMARDGLLPVGLAKVHPTFGTPYRITAITAIMVSVLSGFVPFETLGDLVSIGTLFAFMLVSVGVLVLRKTRPDLPRAFRVPGICVVATGSRAAVRLPDAEPHRRDVGPVPRVDGDRPGRLLRLRPQPLRLGRGEYDKHTPVAAGPTDSTS